MSCVIRRVVGDQFENFVELLDGEWRLREQVEALEIWLREHPAALDPERSWVADIGFCVCSDANGGGPPIAHSPVGSQHNSTMQTDRVSRRG